MATNNKKDFKKRKMPKEKPEFDQQIVDLARVTRVTKGGKQLSFRATVLIGDHNGRVGYGVEKGKDVQIAVEKAVNHAKKNLINVPFMYSTIPHIVEAKHKAAKVLLKPAPQGSGVIAGGAVRAVLEMAGVQNVSSKMLGKTSNKMNNIKATFAALQQFRPQVLKRAEKKKEVVTVVPAVKQDEATEKKTVKTAKPVIKKTVKKETI